MDKLKERVEFLVNSIILPIIMLILTVMAMIIVIELAAIGIGALYHTLFGV